MRQESTLFQSKCMPREGFDEGQDARSRIAWLCRSRFSVADVSAGDMNKTSREMLVVEKAGCDGEGGGKGVIGCDGAGICASTKRCGVEEWKELEVEVELQGRWHCEWKELREGTRKCAASASSPALHCAQQRASSSFEREMQCRSRTYSFNLRQQPQQDEPSMWNAHGHESARFR